MYGHTESRINFWRAMNLGTGGTVPHLDLVMSSRVFEQLREANGSLAVSCRANLVSLGLRAVLAEMPLSWAGSRKLHSWVALGTCWLCSQRGAEYLVISPRACCLAGLWAA